VRVRAAALRPKPKVPKLSERTTNTRASQQANSHMTLTTPPSPSSPSSLASSAQPLTPPPDENAPEHVRKFHNVKARLDAEQRVMFEESANAFNEAVQRVATPEARQFVKDCMVPVVESFLSQHPGNLQPNCVPFFEDVLKGAAHICAWELATLGDVGNLGLMCRLADEGCAFYSDKKGRSYALFKAVLRTLEERGAFASLCGMLKGELPVHGAGGEGGALSAHTIWLMLLCMHRAQAACRTQAGLLAMAQLASLDLRKQKPEDVLELHALLGLDPALSQLHAFSLDLWLRCLACDAFPMKKLGLEMIRKMCAEAARADKWCGVIASHCGG
jgi:hypothetical protein